MGDGEKNHHHHRHLPLQRNVGSPAYCVLYPGDLSPGNKYGHRSSTVWQMFRHGLIRFRCCFISLVFRFDLGVQKKNDGAPYHIINNNGAAVVKNEQDEETREQERKKMRKYFIRKQNFSFEKTKKSYKLLIHSVSDKTEPSASLQTSKQT